MRNPREIREKLADVKPYGRGQNITERRVLLEVRADRAREHGDDEAARRYGSQATETIMAQDSGETRTGWSADVPH